MDTADVFVHRPTGERLTVAFVAGLRVAPCGCTVRYLNLLDCARVYEARPEDRLEKLRYMVRAYAVTDPRRSYAQQRLEDAELVLPGIY